MLNLKDKISKNIPINELQTCMNSGWQILWAYGDKALVFRDMTEAELIEKDKQTEAQQAKAQMTSQAMQAKSNLKMTDYKAIKFVEGFITAEDYAPIRAQRQAWRNEIKQLREVYGINLES